MLLLSTSSVIVVVVVLLQLQVVNTFTTATSIIVNDNDIVSKPQYYYKDSIRNNICFSSKISSLLFAARRDNAPPDFTIIDDDDDDDDDDNDKSSSSNNNQFDRVNLIDANTNNEGQNEEILSSSNRVIEQNRQQQKRRPTVIRQQQRVTEGASWMDRNENFVATTATTTTTTTGGNDKSSFDNNDRNNNKKDDNNKRGSNNISNKRRNNNSRDPTSKTFQQDFYGTRVYVQNIPQHISWQTLKDHFRIAGNVIYASISYESDDSIDKKYKPKNGIVQYETTTEAQNAIDIMRQYPLDGSTLYVRQDVQEKKNSNQNNNNNNNNKIKGPTPPTKWKCANEEEALSILSDNELANIRQLIKARDQARRRRNYLASDAMRNELHTTYNVHIDDRLKLWWLSDDDAKTVPQSVKDIKGDGRWGQQQPWRQIPTTQEYDACVDPDLVEGLLKQRDIARREKDFTTADKLLEQARNSPDGELYLRIHDESRTWRIWTDEPPPRQQQQQQNLTVEEQCLQLVQEYDPNKVDEIKMLLNKFPGREYNILKKLKQRYL